ncbi:MAG TPA: RNA-binding S4 domain-containing protein [Thiotrichales bacterium]|nr:RNA-binding S4 domain-containing protein [Thiotrichales bacterium]
MTDFTRDSTNDVHHAGVQAEREKAVTAREVVLEKQPVELYKVLKFEAMVHSGGMAKHVIEAGEVLVNGEVETRKRRKMVAGDSIAFNGECIRLVAKAD